MRPYANKHQVQEKYPKLASRLGAMGAAAGGFGAGMR
jgi:import receptor subunit TOM70